MTLSRVGWWEEGWKTPLLFVVVINGALGFLEDTFLGIVPFLDKGGMWGHGDASLWGNTGYEEA